MGRVNGCDPHYFALQNEGGATPVGARGAFVVAPHLKIISKKFNELEIVV